MISKVLVAKLAALGSVVLVVLGWVLYIGKVDLTPGLKLEAPPGTVKKIERLLYLRQTIRENLSSDKVIPARNVANKIIKEFPNSIDAAALLPQLAAINERADKLEQQRAADAWHLVRTQGMMKLVAVADHRKADRAAYQEAINGLCSPGQFCSIMFWTNRSVVPDSLPMTDAEAAAQTASYTKNPNTGFEQFLWSCRIKNDPSQCFSD
jgi:hypothetical protein